MSAPYRPSRPISVNIAGRFLREVLEANAAPLEYLIVDQTTKESFLITVKPVARLEKRYLEEHATFTVAGPPGTQCRCCGGSGRE